MEARLTTRTIFCLSAILLLIASFQATAQSYNYRFRSPVLESGTAGQVNAVYRFSNVRTGGTNIDALVKIIDKVGSITLMNIDRTADGYDEAFQPEYRIGSLTDAYLEFEITFVKSGTHSAQPQSLVEVSALDIDGDMSGLLTLKEYNRVNMAGGLCTFNTLGSQLTMAEIGTAFEGRNFTGIRFGALVDTAAKEVMFSVANGNVSSFTYRVGATTLLNSSSTRYASLYFRRFNYPTTGVLSSSPLLTFSGVMNNSHATLNWTLTDEEQVSAVYLEKSSDATNYGVIETFTHEITGRLQPSSSYTDAKSVTGKTWYRLRIVSANGKTVISNIVFFAGATENPAMHAYPTLASEQVTVNYYSSTAGRATVKVVSTGGQQWKQYYVTLQKGLNNFLVNGLGSLPRGTCFIVITNEGHTESNRVIIQ